MRSPKQFNAVRFAPDPSAPAWFSAFLTRFGLEMKRLSECLPGPARFDAGALGATASIALGVGDLVTAMLTQDTAVTVALDQRAGAEGLLELTQDGVGGHVVTWTNVVWTNSTPPVVAAGVGKRTLIGLTCRGDSWVGRVLATNY